MMIPVQLLQREWKHVYDQEDWYPPLVPVLQGVTAEEALWKPEGAACNSIWETVRHLTFYKERLLLRHQGKSGPSGLTNDDTFALGDGSHDEAAWRAAVSRLFDVHESLGSILGAMTSEEAGKPFPTKSFGEQIMSLMLHDAFHTGQIVQIRKLRGTWPGRRSFE